MVQTLKKNMRFLIIDDNAADRLLTAQLLSRQFPGADICEAGNQDDVSQLIGTDVDAVITEFRLNWTDGLALFQDIRKRYALPVIMLTAYGDETLAAAAIKNGMADYIVKDNRHLLGESLTQTLLRPKQAKRFQGEDGWDVALLKLTSDLTYAMRVMPDNSLAFEWLSESLKRIVEVNPALESPNSLTLHVHPDDAASIRHHLNQLLAGFENTSEYRVLDATGKYRWFKDYALPSRDKVNAKINAIYGVLQDITLQRETEQQLRLMQSAIESSTNSIMISGLADTDFAVIYANDAFFRLTGYSSAEVLGKNCRFLQNNDRDQPEITVIRTALQQGCDAHVILRNYRKDGSLFWNEVHISPIRDKQNTITHFVGVNNDVTDRHEMQVLLTRKEAKLRAMFNSVFDGIFIVDEHGLIESTNPSIEKIFGYPSDGLIGLHINLLIGDLQWSWHDLFSHRDNHYMGSKTICVAHETYGLKKDGSTFPMDLTIIEINLENRHVFICTVHDVSKHKQAEDALRKLASHLELAREGERARIAREIHDELGSFLTVLKMDMSWLNKQLPPNLTICLDKTSAIIQQIGEAIETVRRIITDLRPSILDHLGLFAAIEWHVEKFRQQSGIECILSIPDTTVEIDDKHSMAIFRIMQEALTNTILHAMATVVIITINVVEDTLYMRIEDNGCGMTHEQIANNGRYGIKGMHERARYFGGELSLDGRPGQGAIVSLRMPVYSF